ncbi:hypothetical protein ACIQCJ_24860 [Streptomyces sp. NPDC093221]|uniref:hypothetical protein n=1 Tax=Streptomyces sp. NPDC093221 TaxID=3366032 RepID=UPI00382EDA6F
MTFGTRASLSGWPPAVILPRAPEGPGIQVMFSCCATFLAGAQDYADGRIEESVRLWGQMAETVDGGPWAARSGNRPGQLVRGGNQGEMSGEHRAPYTDGAEDTKAAPDLAKGQVRRHI